MVNRRARWSKWPGGGDARLLLPHHGKLAAMDQRYCADPAAAEVEGVGGAAMERLALWSNAGADGCHLPMISAQTRKPEYTARIIEWHADKGFGWLQFGDKRLFLHRRDFSRFHHVPRGGGGDSL